MENKRFFGGNWQSLDAVTPPEMNTGAGADHLPHSFFYAAWDQPMQHDAHAQFESALSSLVSSPSSAAPAAGNDTVVIRELIGRLGSICNSGDNSPSSRYDSTHASCYSTPLNSPPKINLAGGDHHHQHAPRGLPVPGTQMAAAQFAAFAADLGFPERAARFSCFGARMDGGLGAQMGLPEAGNLSRVSSNQSLMAAVSEPERMEVERAKLGGRPSGPSTSEETEHGKGQEVASSAGRAAENSGRKRKAASKGNKAKGPPLSSPSHPKEKNSDTKRCKPAGTSGAAVKPKTEENGDGGQKQGEDNNARPPEPPRDYIHVRARRGQATDSHSLAERVRREKISERMKLLQDLVPGCNKVTGKAVMLDEIINYVQSLQRQVEFLSMKLATLYPQLDFNMDTLLQKDMHQGQQVYPLDMASSAFPFRSAVPPLESTSALRRLPSLQLPPLDGFTDANSQVGNFWEDDLQFVVQMASQSLQAEE